MHFSRNSSGLAAQVVTTVNAGWNTLGVFSSVQLISTVPIQISGCPTRHPLSGYYNSRRAISQRRNKRTELPGPFSIEVVAQFPIGRKPLRWQPLFHAQIRVVRAALLKRRQDRRTPNYCIKRRWSSARSSGLTSETAHISIPDLRQSVQ